ncbi:unnamed protein product [Effrenium voratum]|nr:unnamed protein product [Effrenium voratum]
MLLPLAPPPPGAAVQRHSRRPFSASVHEVSELQELRIPALAPCVPVTVPLRGGSDENDVVLEVLRGPSKGEELQLELYLCVPGKGKARPKTALTVFVRQEEHRASPGPPERLAEGVLRREIGSGKALGSYVVSSLRLTGAESRQQLYCVLQNDDPQETWPWQLRALARIRAKDDSAGEALGAPIGTPDEPPLRCAVLGGVAEPGRIYTCWPEALALYTPKCGKSLGECEELPPGWQQDHISHAWHISHDWDAETVKVEVTSGAVAQCGKEALPWPAAEPTPLVEAEEPVDVTTTLAPLPRVAVEESVAERAQTLVHQERRRPPVPQPPKRLVVRSREDTPREESRTATPTPGTPVARPDLEPPPTERRARLEALLRRRKHGRERIMPDPDFYREDLPRHQANSVPPPRVRRPEREGPGEEMDPPRSARETRNPSLPPIEKERCCGFAGHPVFCCRAEGSRDGKSRHLVRLERRPGSERLGFGNVAAGPATNPVLVISWIRDGALAEWNEKAPEGLAVPVQSAIVSVNGISGDLQRMREALRAQVVDMEIMAPERWRYTKVTRSA